MKLKNKLFVRNIEIKKEQRMFDFKKGIWKKKKTLLQWRTTKVAEMKRIVILMKVDEMYNILKSVLATVYRNSHIKALLVETSLNKWMHFQHVLASWELQQIAYMLYATQIAEEFLRILSLMFIVSCYFMYNAHRDQLQKKSSIF